VGSARLRKPAHADIAVADRLECLQAIDLRDFAEPRAVVIELRDELRGIDRSGA
jgi:hypothetical protein